MNWQLGGVYEIQVMYTDPMIEESWDRYLGGNKIILVEALVDEKYDIKYMKFLNMRGNHILIYETQVGKVLTLRGPL